MSDILLRTGDDILCSGNAPASKLIKKLNRLTGEKGTPALLTHQATIIAPDTKHPKVFESTSISYTGVNGVQENPLREWLDNYDGDVWVIQYEVNRTIGFEASAQNFVESKIGTPYESGIAGGFELFLCGAKLDKVVRWFKPDYNPSSTDNLHCTEVGSLLKKHLNMMDDRAIINRLPPCTWWQGGRAQDMMLVPIIRFLRLKRNGVVLLKGK
jgi:hypothetical protein